MRHETFKPSLAVADKMARNVTSVRHGRYGPTAACAALPVHAWLLPAGQVPPQGSEQQGLQQFGLP